VEIESASIEGLCITFPCARQLKALTFTQMRVDIAEMHSS